MKLRRFGLLYSFVLVVLCCVAQGEVTVQERDAFWKAMQAQYNANPQVIYNDGVEAVPDYPAFLVSNEASYGGLNPPAGGASLQVGFATTMNFNIAAARRPKILLIADQSLEAQAMVSSFYRSLFLVSDTPAEFVANLGGLVLNPRENAQSVLTRIENGETPSIKAIEDLKVKLQALKTSGKVTDLDIQLVENVLREQGRGFGSRPNLNGQVSIFRNAKNASSLAREFAYLYNINRHENAIRRAIGEGVGSIQSWISSSFEGGPMSFDDQHIREQEDQIVQDLGTRMERLSFLHEEGFKAVKKLYAGDRVFYAKGSAEKPELWKGIAEFSRQKRKNISDLYLSNIIPVMGRQGGQVVHAANEGLGSRKPKEFIVYAAPLDTRDKFIAGKTEFSPGSGAGLEYSTPPIEVCVRAYNALGQPITY